MDLNREKVAKSGEQFYASHSWSEQGAYIIKVKVADIWEWDSEWSDLVMEGIGIQNDNYWYPWCSLITGLPGEREEDVIKTLDIIDNLKNNKLYFFIFHFGPMKQSILENEKYSSFQNVTERRWELFCKCWLKTIKSMKKNLLPSLHPSYSGTYIERVNRKISYVIIKKILKETERDLGRYKTDPQGFKDAFTSLNLKEKYLLKFFL